MIQTLNIERLQRLALTIKECFPRADTLIAGGAVRDVLNARPVKDIDAFIYLDGVERMTRDLEGTLRTVWVTDEEVATQWYYGCTELAERLHSEWSSNAIQGDHLSLKNSKGYSYGAFSLVDFPQGFHMTPVQLVFIDMPPVENVRDHFDFGLSQCWVTPDQLRMTKAYWKDHFGHRITYTKSTEPNAQRAKSSMLRAGRLMDKYNWPFYGMGELKKQYFEHFPKPTDREELAALRKLRFLNFDSVCEQYLQPAVDTKGLEAKRREKWLSEQEPRDV